MAECAVIVEVEGQPRQAPCKGQSRTWTPPMNPHDISKDQYDIWHKHYKEILASMRFVPCVDRERTMLYLLETMLLRVRLSIGLGDPGTPTHDLDEICEAEEDPISE